MTLDGVLIAYGSALILPLAVIEGPFVSIMTGFLAAQGYFVWYWAVVLLVCGDVIGDVIAYRIGQASGTPLAGLARRAGLVRVLSPELQRGLTGNAARMLCIGKWTHSIGWVVLVGSGMLRVPLQRFIVVNLLATLPKTAVLFGLGYFVGGDYPLLERHAPLLLAGLGAAGIGGLCWFSGGANASGPEGEYRPMKIAMFTDYFYPELGGIQDSVATISRTLGRRGHQVDIHAPRYATRDYRRVGSTLRERGLGANVSVRRRTSLPFPSSTRQSRAALVSPIAWAELAGREKPDLIHVHSFFGIGLEALLSGSFLGIPVIGTNHTTIAGFGPHIPVSVDWAAAYVMWFYNRCDYVTAPSRSVFDELGATKLCRPHRVVSNPIDIELFTPVHGDERAALRARFGLRSPTITYAGRLGPEKNIEVLLRAVALLRDSGVAAELAIAGHGSHEAVLRAMAAGLGLEGQVRFFGTLPQEELARLLRISDIFAIMSTSETQSMVLLQAMASGVPVVAAQSRALPEFVSASNGVLVDPHDPVRLARALEGLLDSPEQRRQIGSGARRSAERFGVESVTDEWETLYRSVLNGRLAE